MARLDMSGLEAPPLLPGEPATAPLTAFEEDPNQPRTEKIEGPDFEALVEDIRQHGILQPIVVVKEKGRKLRILFGARRFRAACRLELSLIPYVLSTDARQLDGYAQVSENEQRKNLEPIELANFIAKRLQSGDSKAEIARRLGLQASSVTHHLVLTEGAPFIRQLYATERNQSVQFLYRLGLLHAQAPAFVEEQVGRHELTNNFLSTLAERIQQLKQETSQPASSSPAADANLEADGAQLTVPAPVSVSTANDKTQAQAVEKPVAQPPPVEKKKERQKEPSEQPPSIKRPRLQGKYEGRLVNVLLTRLPTSSGVVYVRFEDEGTEAEVPCVRLEVLQLTESY